MTHWIFLGNDWTIHIDVIVWLICNAVVIGLLVVNDIINLGIDIEEEIYINS